MEHQIEFSFLSGIHGMYAVDALPRAVLAEDYWERWLDACDATSRVESGRVLSKDDRVRVARAVELSRACLRKEGFSDETLKVATCAVIATAAHILLGQPRPQLLAYPKIEKIPDVSRERKVKLLTYYEGAVCVCGNSKRKKHWLCAVCKRKYISTDESNRLNVACNAHTKAAYEYMEMVRQRTHKGAQTSVQ